MEVVSELKNNLLKRKEVVVSCEYEGNPGFEKSGKDIAEKFKAKEEQVAVKKIGSSFGTNEFVIEAFIYDSAEDKNRIEPKKKEKKKKTS